MDKAIGNGSDASKTKTPRSIRSGLMRWASSLLLVAVIAAAYAFNVNNRLEQIHVHNLRTLVQMGGSLEQIIINSKKTIASLKKPDYACAFFERQPYLRPVEPITCEEIERFVSPPASECAENGREVEFTPTELLGVDGLNVAVDAQRTCASADGEHSDKSLALTLQFRLREILEATSFGHAFQSVLIAHPEGRVVHQHSPSQHALFQHPDNNVDTVSTSLVVGDLNKLPLAKRAKDPSIQFATFGASTSVDEVRLAGATYTLMCQPLALDSIFDAGARPERSDTANSASEQPGERANAWRICGLVDGGQSVRRSLEVASPLAIAMFAFVMLGILGWPIVKLLTLTPRERMNFVELYVATLATIAILMVVTVLLLSVDRAAALRSASENRLASIANQLHENLTAEFEKVRQQLTTYDDKLVEYVSGDACKPDAGKWSVTGLLTNEERCDRKLLPRPEVYPFLSQVFWMRLCDGQQLYKATVRKETTPHVSVASRPYFKNIKSRQLWAPPPGTGKTSDEKYFVQSFQSLTTGEFSAALSMRSKLELDDSSKSIPGSKGVCPEDADQGIGMALSLRPVSVMYPVLAPGLGFAIVDDDTGMAVFHSDDRYATVENLFSDEGIARRLRAVIRSRAEAHFNALYRARPHQLFVKPFPDTPWSIVTFSDVEIVRTRNLEVLSRAILLISIHLLFFGLATGSYLLIRGRDTPFWIWPMAHWEQADRETLYRGVSLLLGAAAFTTITFVILLPVPQVLWAVALAQIILLIVFSNDLLMRFAQSRVANFERFARWIAGAIVLIAIIAIGFVSVYAALFWVLALAASWFFVVKSPRQKRLRGYVIAFSLLSVLVAIPPAIGYFKIAHHYDVSVFSKLETDFSNRGREKRYREFLNYSKDFPGAESYPSEVVSSDDASESKLVERGWAVQARNQYPIVCTALSSYLQQSASSDALSCGHLIKSQPTSYGEWINGEFSRFLPIYNEPSSYSRYTMAAMFQENPQYDWKADGAGRQREADAAQIQYALPIAEATLVGGGMLLLLLWAWITYCARRIFFGELDPHAHALTIADIVGHEISRHTIATLATRAQYAFITADESRHKVYNLAEPSALEELEKSPHAGRIICTHLGDALCSDALRVRVLGLLEVLADRPQGDVLVVSSIPIAETRSRVAEGDDISSMQGRELEFPFKADGESARWRNLLTKYQNVDVSVRGDADARLCGKATLWKMPDKQWLECELGAIAGLTGIMGPDYAKILTPPLSRREVIKEIGKRANWFYKSLWDNCSIDEKLALTQLSREGVVNPRQANAVRQLLARGLLRMDPVLKPINHSFGRFVASVADISEIAGLESADRAPGLNKRTALLGLILLVLLFLWFTQREVVETWIAYIGAIAVGMSAVLRMMDGLKGGAQQR